ncbi:hypothetical protein [Marivirga sp.]|uniref:hypothetical protein n=1 Tax=Marivirga sp. TaxID=2018662 RepID=UPI002D7EC006|nr:hypothetical protein [Marivirga sp.]HET8860412.1 hypothetical protein [Marivirga sp.]
MKAKMKILTILFLSVLFCKNSFAQNADYVRVGNLNSEIYLDKYDDYYLLTYEDNNMGSQDEIISFKIKNEAEVKKLYQKIKNSFNEKI